MAARRGDRHEARRVEIHRHLDLEPVWDYPPFVELIAPEASGHRQVPHDH
jgi:hypothetical protein